MCAHKVMNNHETCTIMTMGTVNIIGFYEKVCAAGDSANGGFTFVSLVLRFLCWVVDSCGSFNLGLFGLMGLVGQSRENNSVWAFSLIDETAHENMAPVANYSF